MVQKRTNPKSLKSEKNTKSTIDNQINMEAAENSVSNNLSKKGEIRVAQKQRKVQKKAEILSNLVSSVIVSEEDQLCIIEKNKASLEDAKLEQKESLRAQELLFRTIKNLKPKAKSNEIAAPAVADDADADDGRKLSKTQIIRRDALARRKQRRLENKALLEQELESMTKSLDINPIVSEPPVPSQRQYNLDFDQLHGMIRLTNTHIEKFDSNAKTDLMGLYEQMKDAENAPISTPHSKSDKQGKDLVGDDDDELEKNTNHDVQWQKMKETCVVDECVLKEWRESAKQICVREKKAFKHRGKGECGSRIRNMRMTYELGDYGY